MPSTEAGRRPTGRSPVRAGRARGGPSSSGRRWPRRSRPAGR